MKRYVALLRGINVGGQNLIRMSELKACFEALGLEQVRTYIQSGNVVFGRGASGAAGPRADQARLTNQIEAALSKTFDYEASLVLRSLAQMRAVLADAPQGFGGDQAMYRYDVIFLKEPLTATEAMKRISTREGVDQAFAGKGVLYTSRLISRASQTRLTRIIGTPVYQSMTIRNWNTTIKLLGMLEEAG
jgi:uncharacterized protein (DUF1697 family)